MNTENQARLQILSQIWEVIQTQTARIEQTLERVLDEDASLAERIHTLLHVQGITVIQIITPLSLTISTIVLAITGVFGGGWSPATSGPSPLKDEETLKNWLNKQKDDVKRLAMKVVEASLAIVGSVAGAILIFLSKAVVFVAEHTWGLIVLATRFIGVWLMWKVVTENRTIV